MAAENGEDNFINNISKWQRKPIKDFYIVFFTFSKNGYDETKTLTETQFQKSLLSSSVHF